MYSVEIYQSCVRVCSDSTRDQLRLHAELIHDGDGEMFTVITVLMENIQRVMYKIMCESNISVLLLVDEEMCGGSELAPANAVFHLELKLRVVRVRVNVATECELNQFIMIFW